ncbi:MAG: hypothetical protein HWD92_04950 [Flavobacteriia bacterium]|nr:hypothetical protein [Flavobacteriia bacterium]
MKYTWTLLPLIFTCSCNQETSIATSLEPLVYHSVDDHLRTMYEWTNDSLIERGILEVNGRDTVLSEKYLDPETGEANDSVFGLYMEISFNVARAYLQNGPLYMQHLEHNDMVYVLYFEPAGMQDFGWRVVKFTKAEWGNPKYYPPPVIEGGEGILFNYDEGEANKDSVHIFIQEPFLVMSRGGLFYSLYNLENDSALFNNPSPWHEDSENTLDWVRTHLHEPIQRELEKK